MIRRAYGFTFYPANITTQNDEIIFVSQLSLNFFIANLVLKQRPLVNK